MRVALCVEMNCLLLTRDLEKESEPGQKVFVYNSYDIKEKLKVLGFRFNSEERVRVLNSCANAFGSSLHRFSSSLQACKHTGLVASSLRRAQVDRRILFRSRYHAFEGTARFVIAD